MDWKDSLNLPVSAQGEWAAKRFYGDPKRAARYLPVAYALLGEVKNRMAYGGVSYGHQMAWLPDGTRIQVIRNGEHNIIMIETVPTVPTVPVVGREIFPIFPGTGIAGLVFYPRTESAPLGIYTPAGPAARHPVPVDQLPFATLSYQYNEEEEKFDLNAAAPVNTQSGNQFFIDENGSVYSWWHSPCGDGPVVSHQSVNSVLSEYSPFFIHSAVGTLYYKDANGNGHIIQKIIYKDGAVWLDLNTAWVIAGFWTGEVEVEPEVFETRYVIALYITVQLAFLVFRQDGEELVKIPTDPEEFQWQNKWVKNSSSWPVRFNKTGSEASVIIANSTDPDDYSKGLFDHLIVCTVGITHAKDSVTLVKSEVLHFLGDRVSTDTVKSYKKTTITMISSTPGGEITLGFRDGEWDFSTKYKATFSQGVADIPIALNYKDGATLNFVYVETNPQPTESENSYIGNRWYELHEWVYVKETGFYARVFDDYWATNYKSTTVNTQSYFSKIKTALGAMYEFDTTATRTSESARVERDRLYSNVGDISGTPGFKQAVSARYIHRVQAARPDWSNPSDGNIRLLYVSANKEEIVTANYVSSVTNPGTLTQYNETYSGYITNTPNSSFAEHTNEISGYRDDLRSIGAIVTVHNRANKEELVAVTKEQRDTTVFTEPTFISNNPAWPTYNEFESVSGTLFSIIDSIPNSFDDDSISVTTDETPVYVNILLALFDNSPPVSHSYVEDPRIVEERVWARSLRVNATMAGDPNLVVNESKTDSTFGPLTQHVFLLDAEGVITDQPVNDPTLTTHPIGLF